ncbi:MAG: energy-coupling factor transporter transmembrane protein EcfT [Gemmatimonadetes bacterium]|nr:energy-coupling factor transporter transmembrane protein EcfT [Gemmatimonadota bacterium]
MSVGFVPGSGPLHRAHPFTPLAIAASTAVLAFALPVPFGPMILAGVLLLLVLVERAPVLKPALLTALPFWFFLYVIHGVFGKHPVIALGLSARVFAIVLGFLLALATVHPGRLVDALAERGVPFSFSFLLTATLQAVPRLRARATEILAAQRCRGLRVRGSIWRRAAAVIPLAVPLVLSAVAEVDERAIALEARGMGGVTNRTPLHPPPDSAVQRLIRWGLAAGTVTAIAVRFV